MDIVAFHAPQAPLNPIPGANQFPMYSLFPIPIFSRMAATAHFLHVGKADLPMVYGSQHIPVFGIVAIQTPEPAMLNRYPVMLL
jgi:hypothetical protein